MKHFNTATQVFMNHHNAFTAAMILTAIGKNALLCSDKWKNIRSTTREQNAMEFLIDVASLAMSALSLLAHAYMPPSCKTLSTIILSGASLALIAVPPVYHECANKYNR